MLLTGLILIGVLLYVLGSPDRSKEWQWVLGVLGGALILVGGYNLGLAGLKSWAYQGGYAFGCYSGAWPVIAIIVGVGLVVMAVVEWIRERPSGGEGPSIPERTTSQESMINTMHNP